MTLTQGPDNGKSGCIFQLPWEIVTILDWLPQAEGRVTKHSLQSPPHRGDGPHRWAEVTQGEITPGTLEDADWEIQGAGCRVLTIDGRQTMQ